MSFLSILQRWTRKSTQRLCDNKLAATRKCVLSLPVGRDCTQVFTQSFDVKSLTFPMTKRTYPCNGNKVREKLFAETRLSLPRGKGLKSKWATAILPRPIFSRFTSSSLPFPSPSDACVCCYAGYSPRHLEVRFGSVVLSDVVDYVVCFSYSSNIKHGVSSLSRVRERQVDNLHGFESPGQCCWVPF